MSTNETLAGYANLLLYSAMAVYAGDDATICDVFTTKTAAYGPLEYPSSKHGTIGVRVQPQLLPFMGGEILGGQGPTIRRGRADEVASGQPCDFVAYENDTPSLGRYGVCLLVLENTAASDHRGPWFIRDYGMAMFNASMQDAIRTEDGGTWTAGLRVTSVAGTDELMSYYPPAVKTWIAGKGGLTAQMKRVFNGTDLWAIIDPCPDEH